jgi:hypothetical protein
VVNFGQTHPINARQIFCRVGRCKIVPERIMAISTSYKYAIPTSYKYKEYARYAAHCLNMVAATKDQESRVINREMAAEWLKLADADRHLRDPRK